MRRVSYAVRELDRIDRAILRMLQRDGRIAMTDLAQRVGLSVTPCAERVRRLEEEGVILGYYARLNPQSLGGKLLVFVELRLESKSGRIFDQFRREVAKLPEVLECHLVSGDFDYLLKVRLPEMAAYRRVLGELLLQLPGVKESRSAIVMEEVKETLELAVEEPGPGAPQPAVPVESRPRVGSASTRDGAAASRDGAASTRGSGLAAHSAKGAAPAKR